MELDHFLNQRLKFVQFFYSNTVAAFEEIVRKINAGEPPYIDERPFEDCDEPAFLEEWSDAQDAMNVAGVACLDILQSTLHVFLDEYMCEIGGKHLVPRMKEMGRKSWFRNYEAFFDESLGIKWANSGVDLNLIEQVILARNDFTHNPDLLSVHSFQTDFHSTKHPDSAFTRRDWPAFFKGKVLYVSAEDLARAIEAVRQFAEYLESERQELMLRLRVQARGKE
jgi:hypothetical protein